MAKFTTYVDMGCLGEPDVEVEYEYYEGYAGDRETPPEEPEIEVLSVRVVESVLNHTEIADMINKDAMYTIEQECWDDVKSYTEPNYYY